MDQSTANEILQGLGALRSDVKNQNQALAAAEARSVRDQNDTNRKLDEVRGALSSRFHDVNNNLAVMQARQQLLEHRVDKIEPTVDGLEKAKDREAGAAGATKTMWAAATAVLASAVSVIGTLTVHWLTGGGSPPSHP